MAPPGSSGSLDCQVLVQAVKNGRHFSPGQHFDKGWKVRNTGKYTMARALRHGIEYFCEIRLTISVAWAQAAAYEPRRGLRTTDWS